MDDDDIGTVRWWGESWGAPVNDPRAEVEVPIGVLCVRCGKAIDVDDKGVTIPHLTFPPNEEEQVFHSWHLKCWFESLGIEGVW